MSTQAQYEFSTEQNTVIDQLAGNMRLVGVFMLLIGVLYILGFVAAVIHAFYTPIAIGQAILLGVAVLFYLAMGKWTSQAAQEFRRIVTSTGQDVSHLMGALDNLRKLYLLIGTIIKVYIVLAIIGLVSLIVTVAVNGFRA